MFFLYQYVHDFTSPVTFDLFHDKKTEENFQKWKGIAKYNITVVVTFSRNDAFV